jgi:NADH-ubiquinone oxidoreductase chain 6
MSSLSPNEKIKFFINSNKIIIFILLITFFNDKYFILQINEQSSITYKNNLIERNLIILSKIYDIPNNTITTLIISYLLLTLIIIVKITNLFNGPLRIKN